MTHKTRLSPVVALIPLLTVFLASCSGSEGPVAGVPTPDAVPAGAVAVVGDSQITTDEFERTLDSLLSGYDPLSPTRVAPEPLDPPRFERCLARITESAKGDPDLAGLGRADFLASCHQRYQQLRALTLSRLIRDQWTRVEAELEGLEVSEQETEAFIGQLRLSWASRPAQSRRRFREAVETSGVTPDELRSRAELAVARQRLAARASGEGKPPTSRELQAAERERFDAWRAKTLCGRALLVPECSNGPDST